MTMVSYAQNFEDVMLWRALKHIKNGFYIDVGAQHPVVDSVSKVFYEQGWRGIHVEAIATYAELLRQDRPDEIVLNNALADVSGTLTFYEIPETGLSTGDDIIARRHQENGFAVKELTIPGLTLAEVFSKAGNCDIHWLKIDVEGLEQKVLAGWGESNVQPWIVVIESMLPKTQIEKYEGWEHLLLERGYKFVYFDGLNRFYIAKEHPELITAFQSGPNIFDNFSLNVGSYNTFATLLNNQLHNLQQLYQQEIEQNKQIYIEQQSRNDLLIQEANQQLQKFEIEHQELVQTNESNERKLQEARKELSILYSSFAWRITAPLRWLARKIK